MKNLPKLPPLYLQAEVKSGYQKQAWKPTWKCFCCHDSGLVRESLVRQVIDEYDPSNHKQVRCNASSCQSSLSDNLFDTLDNRFSIALCDKLDLIERQMWAEWSKEQNQKRLRLIDSNITKNLRLRSRTNYEQLEVERRHQNIRNDY